MSPTGNSAGDLIAGLQDDFIDEVREILEALELQIGHAQDNGESAKAFLDSAMRAAVLLQRSIASPKGELIKTIATRMQDFLAGVHGATARTFADVQKFMDVLLDIVNGEVDEEAESSSLVRSLPAKTGFLPEDVEVRDVEVMLVMPHGAATSYVEREMQQCGYRTSVVEDTLHALPMIVRVRPDFVVVSAMMPGLDGIDLVIGLASMPATRNIPFALLTSLDDDDESLKLVPKHIPVIHKSGKFGDDLADALSNVFLI
ncbi:MAG: hypothetical protein OQK35_01210 [Alphaproteobacteria bacterium]|nr:hypothetical protein [Rhodospirillales bacterium]MCW9044929.1 hypothetical protein [Alphaproteobacteria bacterium]